MNPEFESPNGKPEFRSLGSLEVFPGRPIVVNDITENRLRSGVSMLDFDVAAKILFASSFPIQPEYITAQELTEPMTNILQGFLNNVDGQASAVIFLGNGALPVYETCWEGKINFDPWNTYKIKAERIFENNKPKSVFFEFPKVMRDAFEFPRYKKIFVIDDVIATGMTINALKKRLNYPSQYIAISWFLRKPRTIEGYDCIASVLEYKSSDPDSYPALNSLSTWLRTDEKGFIVRENYKKKYISPRGYPRGFDKQINYIRGLTTIA
jgi:hypothetical protein